MDTESATTTEAPPKPAFCPFVKYTPMKVHRRQIQGAPYNPRRLTEKKRAKLKKNLEKVGLLNSPVWNKRTGFLVGGHQRVSILDSLMQTDDYELFVDAVDLDEKTEREQNIALNSSELQGEWDPRKLGEMFRGEKKVDIEPTGFDLGQIYSMFGAKGMEGNADGMAALSAAVEENKKTLAGIRDTARQRDGMDYYRVLTFASDDEAIAFDFELSRRKIRRERQIVDGRAFAKAFNVPMGEDETEADQS